MARELPSITTALQSSLPAGIPISHLAATITLLSRLEGVEQATGGFIGHFGPFQVLRALGEGGMGVVMLAKDSRNDAVVAVKVLKPGLKEHSLAVQRFLSEAHHMSRLKHPHILPVLDQGLSSLGPYYAMPYCDKGSLAHELVEGRPLAPERILEVLIPVAEALTHAHGRGLIHRDLKPGNILLTEEGGIYLSDFGLARTLFNELTLDVEGSHCEGTAPYLSPAVAEGQAEDTRCDVYSLGGILYQMLTGHLPYEGRTTEEVIAKIKAGPPRPILERNPNAMPELVIVCEAAMARDQRDRYANMADFLGDLRRVQRGDAPLGAHASAAWVNRARVIWRRHWPKMVAGACLGAAAMGVWLSGWFSPPALKPVQTIYLGEGFDYANAIVANWDNDGERLVDFLVPNRQEQVIQVVDAHSNLLQLIPKNKMVAEGENAEGFIIQALDVTGDGVDELVVKYGHQGKARTKVINANLLTVAEFEYDGEYTPATREHKASTTSMSLGWWEDLDKDQKPEFLFSYSTAYGQRRPRGLALFDGETHALRWDFPTAPYIVGAVLEDVDGDGGKEIIVGTHASNNGKTLPDGTDDDHAYWFVLDAQGQLKWRRAMGDYYTAVVPFTLKGGLPATERLYAWLRAAYLARYSLEPEQRGSGVISRVFYVAPNGEGLREYVPPFELVDLQPADVTGDGRQEIVMTDTNGWLRVLNQDLQVMGQIRLLKPRNKTAQINIAGNARLPQLSSGPYIALLCVDFDTNAVGSVGRTQREIVTDIFYDVAVVILDAKLRPVLQTTLQPVLKRSGISLRAEVRDVDGDNADEIVVFSDRVTICKVVKE